MYSLDSLWIVHGISLCQIIPSKFIATVSYLANDDGPGEIDTKTRQLKSPVKLLRSGKLDSVNSKGDGGYYNVLVGGEAIRYCYSFLSACLRVCRCASITVHL